jgi:hypothetical protein
MSPTNSLRSSTIRLARGVAAARHEHLCTTFEDSLTGDLARLQVWRRIRHEFPGMKPDEIDALIEELLTP